MSVLITQTAIQTQPNMDALTSTVIDMLRGMGVLFPAQIEEDEVQQFPIDITQISLVELGSLQSYWSAMYARSTGLHGVLTAQKRSLKYQISKMKPTAIKNDQVALALSDLEAQFARVDVAEAIMGGVVDGHKRYADACSREISRIRIEADLSR